MSTNKLIVSGVDIRVTNDGLYSLTNLHEASGGLQAHRPKYFLETAMTQSLIKILERDTGANPVQVTRGKYGGTYVHRHLAISYAMWISPEFHLQVIRTFDAVVLEDMDLAISEKDRGLLALYRKGLEDNSLPRRMCEFQIAYMTNNQEALDRIDREDEAERDWQENTAEGFVATYLKNVGPGYEHTFDVPFHLDADEVEQEVRKLFKKRKLGFTVEKIPYFDAFKIYFMTEG